MLFSSLFVWPNEVVENVYSRPHRAVNQTKYQGRSGGDILERQMARYKHIDTSPRFLAVDLQRQLLPSIIEHAVNYLINHHIDLTLLDAKFCNDVTGAAA